MTAKTIVERWLARRDIEAAIDHYFSKAGEAVALGFVEALETAYNSSQTIQPPALRDTPSS